VCCHPLGWCGGMYEKLIQAFLSLRYHIYTLEVVTIFKFLNILSYTFLLNLHFLQERNFIEKNYLNQLILCLYNLYWYIREDPKIINPISLVTIFNFYFFLKKSNKYIASG